MHHHLRSWFRSRVAHVRPHRLFLLALLGATSLAVTQCRVVDDTVTGVDIRATSRLRPSGACLHGCAATIGKARRDEHARHRAALSACGRDPVCKKLEQRRHRDVLRRLARLAMACRHECYDEGQVIGGR